MKQLKKKEKRTRYWWTLIAGFLVVICITIGVAIAAMRTRRNTTPQVIWQYDVGSTIVSAPLIVDSTAYFGTLNDNNQAAFYAVDTVTGQEKWYTPVSDSIFYWLPAIVDNTLFFATDDGYFLALDAQTGHEQWRFSSDQREGNSQNDPKCHWCTIKFRPPATANGIIYVASYDDHLYALDALTGKEQWRFNVNGLFFHTPVIVDGLLYAGNQDGHIYVLDAATGIKKQRYFLGEKVYSLLIEGDMLYAAVGNDLVALNRHTGEEQWQIQHPWSA